MSQNKNNTDSLKYLHALRMIPEIGNRTLQILSDRFGGFDIAWNASDTDIWELDLRSENTKKALIEKRRNIDPEKEWEKLQKSDIILLTPNHHLYPALLKEIPDKPETLYIRGSFDWEDVPPMIALVGSRKHTAYGEQAALSLSADLTRAGFLVVSGLAFGIDSLSHTAALEAGGQTIAVLGSGVSDMDISPRSHFPLAQRILGNGALVSEYPPGFPVTKWAFPERDRIIAALCLGTVVIEAPESSGSLITARMALEYNREVFSVPGSIFSPSSIGTNNLLKNGAKVVCGIRDILEEFPHTSPSFNTANSGTSSLPNDLSSEEVSLLSALSHEPAHIDKIIKITKLQTAHASSLLAVLEIKGLAKDIGGMHYVRMNS